MQAIKLTSALTHSRPLGLCRQELEQQLGQVADKEFEALLTASLQLQVGCRYIKALAS